LDSTIWKKVSLDKEGSETATGQHEQINRFGRIMKDYMLREKMLDGL
jgi:hypothetical protein